MIEQTYREFVMKELFVKDFFEIRNGADEFVLEEKEEDGKSILHFSVDGKNTFAIMKVDAKNTNMGFFRGEKFLSLGKRVDHIVLEETGDNQWIAHLIEMKSGISYAEKWTEIKGKFRASYLLVQALCAMLHMELLKVRMYTTFENVCLKYAPENMISRRTRIGMKAEVPEVLWSGERFVLRFGNDC